MARPVNADARATRLRILRAARSLFADRGEDGVSVREIAKQARVSLATVHHYYGSKGLLYQACVDSFYVDLAGLRRDLEPALFTGGNLAALLDGAVRTSFRFAREHRDAIRILIRRVLTHGELDPAWVRAYQGPLLDRAGQLLAAVTGYELGRARLILLSVQNLIVRYALSSPAELVLFAGIEVDTAERALSAVEDHLVMVAQKLIC